MKPEFYLSLWSFMDINLTVPSFPPEASTWLLGEILREFTISSWPYNWWILFRLYCYIYY